MDTYAKVILLVVLSLILSASSLSPQNHKVANNDIAVSEFEQLLAEEELVLQEYEQELLAKGEEFFAEQESQLRRAQEQELQNAAKDLVSEFESEGIKKQKELSEEILRHQLEMVLVSLNEDQQSLKAKQIMEANSELTKWEKQAQSELEESLEQLRLEYEEQWLAERKELQIRLEKSLAEQFKDFQEERWQVFEEKSLNLSSELRRQLANR